MYKQIGTILLVAGTCIGSGMIALPMVLAKLGLIPSIVLMMTTWFIMYYSSLINLELNLQTGSGLSLGGLGRHFSGKSAELIGTISLKLLSYSLLAVFIYGGASIIQELMISKMALTCSFTSVATGYAFSTAGLLIMPIKFIDRLNRLLFLALIAIVGILLAGLATTINWSELPLFSKYYNMPTAWIALIPVVFTSFGFHVIFHTMANYCNMDAKMLKNGFFWGSLIPTIVYIVWTSSILAVAYQTSPEFYDRMAAGKAEVGELIQVLSGITGLHSVQLLVWWISLLAIATSVLGVALGLHDSIRSRISKIMPNAGTCNLFSSLSTVVPAYLAVICVPNAFIAILGFAGMILAIIAILQPVYLLRKINAEKLYYPELRRKSIIRLSTVAAVIVIICELVREVMPNVP